MLEKAALTVLFLITFCLSTAVSEDQEFWRNKGISEINDALNIKHNTNVAKNVIVFIGDGMSLSTTTSSRIYSKGEAGFLTWEKFDNVGLLKTYSNDKYVPDSSCTATALFCGMKTNFKTTGVDASVQLNDCEASLIPEKRTSSIFSWAMESGRSTGFVTTTTVTHATPSALYVHTANRNWECEANIPANSKQCKDIARQLVEDLPGRNIKVIMGGGRQMLQSNSSEKPNDPLDRGACIRSDGRDLIEVWKKDKEDRKVPYAVVSNNAELNGMDESSEYLLGIFANGHLQKEFEKDEGPQGMPSLKTMTEKAIKTLQKNKDGFILMVEGGLIDKAHHSGNARQALDETRAFDDAVESALSLVDTKDTLIIVTSDHSHGMTFVGHLDRNQSIFGSVSTNIGNKTPYTSLLYVLGGDKNFQYEAKNGSVVRRDPTQDQTDAFEYSQQAGFHDDEGKHSGEDVLVYATGPMAHLVHSVREQTFVAYLISYAAKIGPAKDIKSDAASRYSACCMFLVLPVLFLLNTCLK
ncbi:hypothetical protein WA026_005246 [Henosepilachna vigintioctopunctata]|uniref:Alkaline phosphatase n=1 Tax=Henosepilachna vigintioctopunctata TaxID=420089 RepID=A0AAW1UXJ4_9CUCU